MIVFYSRLNTKFNPSLIRDDEFSPTRRLGAFFGLSLDEPKFPEGFKLRIVEPEKDATQWVEMFNQTFIDHWNHHDFTVEEFLHHCQHSEYNSDLNLIAIGS